MSLICKILILPKHSLKSVNKYCKCVLKPYGTFISNKNNNGINCTRQISFLSIRDSFNVKQFQRLVSIFPIRYSNALPLFSRDKKCFSAFTSNFNKSGDHKPGLADELLASKIEINENKGENEKNTKSEEDKEKTLRTIKFTFYAFGVIITSLGGFLIYSWGSPKLDIDGRPIEDEFSDLPLLKQYIYRTLHEAKNMNKMIQEPSRDKLLPDPLKEPYVQPLYTLVLEMKDVLVHPEWTYETGWRFKKRPGVDFLLQHCGPPLFEIVIYTNEQAFTAYPVIEQLDPNSFIWYKLFKDSTRYTNGKHLKDLNCLNRDLNKVIVVDWDRGAITSPRNQLTLRRWDGNMKDQALVELAMMLRTIAESQVSDVREVLDYYRSFEDPIEAFKENQRVAQAHEEELQKAVKEQSYQKGLTSSWSSTFLRRK